MGTHVHDEPKPPFPQQHQEKPGIESKLDPRPRYQAPDYKGADKLRDKVALITGGDSGIGRSVAVLYAREGADVAIVYLPVEQGDAEVTRRAVESEGRRALLIAGDVTDPAFCREAVEKTVRELGRLDILVNNAAFQQSRKEIGEISVEQLDRTFRTNIYAYFFLAQAAIPHLKKGAAIVNCGSSRGWKAVLISSITRRPRARSTPLRSRWRRTWCRKGIRVNCVAPGPVWTPLNASDKPPEKVAVFGKDTPMQRPAQPEEVAPAFVFFASEVDSSYITGEVLTLLGGETTAA